MEEIRVLSPQGMLGYGFPVESFKNGMAKNPHAIAVDAGSTDAGPHKLGAGVGIVSKFAVKRDLSLILGAAKKEHIPVLIGSAGGSGGKKHVEWTLSVIEEVAKENNWKLKTAVIDTSIDKNWLKEQIAAGRVTPLPGLSDLKAEEVDASTEIVAQIGHEPYLAALEAGVDLIVAGRSYDPAMTASVCIHYGFDKGLAYHMGKILECGALCAVPGSAKDCMMGYMHKDDFVVESLNPNRYCTTTSVAAHTLYEKSHPYLLPGPGGTADLSKCTFIQVNPHAVQVQGSAFLENEQYIVKLEGAKLCGYRSIFIAGIRDPKGIAYLDEILEYTKDMVAELFGPAEENSYFVDFKVYGRDAIMADKEPRHEIAGHEVGIVAEIVAPTQEKAEAICAYARSTMLHYHYTDRYATAGNLAFPFAPSDFNIGAVYEFNVYHLVPIDNPTTFFPIKYITLG